MLTLQIQFGFREARDRLRGGREGTSLNKTTLINGPIKKLSSFISTIACGFGLAGVQLTCSRLPCWCMRGTAKHLSIFWNSSSSHKEIHRPGGQFRHDRADQLRLSSASGSVPVKSLKCSGNITSPTTRASFVTAPFPPTSTGQRNMTKLSRCHNSYSNRNPAVWLSPYIFSKYQIIAPRPSSRLPAFSECQNGGHMMERLRKIGLSARNDASTQTTCMSGRSTWRNGQAFPKFKFLA